MGQRRWVAYEDVMRSIMATRAYSVKKMVALRQLKQEVTRRQGSRNVKATCEK
jgi:hypothetical protein